MRALLIAALLVSAALSARADVIIDRCEQFVARDTIGRLGRDLECSTGIAVILGDGATLDLNGHVLSSDGAPFRYGVRCVGWSCAVVGPGTLTGFESAILYNGETGRIDATGVDLIGNGFGIGGGGFRKSLHVRVTDSTIDGTTRGTGNGVDATTIRAEKVTVRRHENGFVAKRRFVGIDVVVEENAERGIVTSDLPGSILRGKKLAARANGEAGVSALQVRLDDSDVTGNGRVDLVAARRPRLRNVACGTSEGPGGTPWGVCTADGAVPDARSAGLP